MEPIVKLQFPVEYGTWQATPEYMHKRFARELLIVGGYDKLVLEKGRDAIDAELEWHTSSNEGKVASSLCRTT